MTTGTPNQAGTGANAVQPRARRSILALGLLLALGLVLYWPAIRAHYLLDDYLHASMVRGTFPAHRSPFDLYDFVSDSDRSALAARGLLPWWSNPALKIRFFRPLSSILLWTDHRIFGDALFPLHLHSLVWWVFAVLAARALFQKLLAPRVALIATFVFGLAPCHSLPLAWLANREALISLTFGLLGLGAVLRFHERGRWLDALFAALLFSLSILGGEYALSLGGYVLCLAIAARGVRGSRRWVGILAFAIPTSCYLVLRSSLGYGTVGSGFYTDPLADPMMFLQHAPRRAATLLATGWLSLDGETVTAATPTWVLASLFVLGAGLVVYSLVRTFSSLDSEVRPTAYWLLAGSLLAIVPVLAVVPSPRLLGANMVGTAAVIAFVLDKAWFRTNGRSAELAGLVALALGFFHFVHGPATSWLVGRQYQITSAGFAESAKRLSAHLGDVDRSDVFVMRGMGGSFFMPFALQANNAPPNRWRILAQTGHVLALRRGPHTIDLVATDSQGIYPSGAGNLFRSEATPAYVGGVVSLPGQTATILEMGPKGPRVVRFEMDEDLDAFDWVAEDKLGFKDVAPPAVGFGKPFDP